MPRPFHLALPCIDLNSTRDFYSQHLGCAIGRSSDSWVDLNFFGHQLVFHDCGGATLPTLYNPVDVHQVPVPHLGAVLEPEQLKALAASLEGKVEFIIPLSTRFAGTAGEQSTLFFKDPNGYALEFKSFADDRFIFEPFEDQA